LGKENVDSQIEVHGPEISENLHHLSFLRQWL